MLALALDGPGIQVYRRDASDRWAPLAVPSSFTGAATMVAFSRDGRILASASALQRVDISAVDADAIRPVSAIALPGRATSVPTTGLLAPHR